MHFPLYDLYCKDPKIVHQLKHQFKIKNPKFVSFSITLCFFAGATFRMPRLNSKLLSPSLDSSRMKSDQFSSPLLLNIKLNLI